MNTDTRHTEAETLPASVVVVDDVAGLRTLYRKVLEQRSSLEVVGEGSNGREGIEAAREHDPDLVLLDLSMPEMDGLEALPKIKEAAPDARVVILSGFCEDRLGDRARNLGAAGYLEKTGDPESLVPRLEAVLGIENELECVADDGAASGAERSSPPSTPSDEELETFAYAASHDLQEPLRMVASYLKLLREALSEDRDREVEECLEHAEAGVERMRSMVDGLLAYSRVETRAEDRTHVDLEETVDGALANLTVAMDASDTVVHYDPLPPVEGEPGQLTELFQNLVGNAIQHSDGDPRVHIGAERRDGTVEVHVTDDGPGIPEDERERVFSLFQQGRRASNDAGSGMGLAICRRIVERHDGEIWIADEGEGTTFRFTLPAAPEDPEEAGT